MFETIEIRSTKRIELIDITDKVNSIIVRTNIKEGVCFLNVPHTTAGITINENADSDVVYDILAKTNKLVPVNDNYAHTEGNSDSHIKSSLFGQTLSVIIENNRALLGRWQSVYFCEFDGPRNRKVYIKIFGG
jgi:secondary thiamine-phosphate synthase enzyme